MAVLWVEGENDVVEGAVAAEVTVRLGGGLRSTGARTSPDGTARWAGWWGGGGLFNVLLGSCTSFQGCREQQRVCR